MPGFNGRGPLNEGTMTGRGRGYCIKKLEPGEKDYYSGYGFGRRIGRGNVSRRRRGFRCWGSPLNDDSGLENSKRNRD